MKKRTFLASQDRECHYCHETIPMGALYYDTQRESDTELRITCTSCEHVLWKQEIT